jgi:hypothetical protein
MLSHWRLSSHAFDEALARVGGARCARSSRGQLARPRHLAAAGRMPTRNPSTESTVSYGRVSRARSSSSQAREIAAAFGGPMVSTSLNRAGESAGA